MALECNFCGKKYKSDSWFNKHMLTHQDKPTSSSNTTVTAVTGSDGSSSAGPHCTDNASTSHPAPTTSDPFNEDGGDDDDNDDEAEAIAAAQNVDWGDWSGTDDDEEVETYLNVEPWREEEEEEARRAALAGQANVDPPKPKKTAPPALVKCHQCQTAFTTLDGYIKHCVGHGMEAALLRIPAKEEILKECSRLASATLQEIGNTKLQYGPAKKVADIALCLDQERDTEDVNSFVTCIFESLFKFFDDKKVFCLPSVFVLEFLKHSASVSVNVSLLKTLKEIISKKTGCGGVECDIFVANFLSKFSSKLLALLLRVLREGDTTSDCVNLEDRYAKTSQSTVSLDFKQNMHYIGGSNVKSFLKRALRIRHRNDEWEKVISVVRNNFLISEFSQAPDAELKAWTEAVDRGKLTKISSKALDFFVQLGKEVKPLERLDGSIIQDEVFRNITKSPYLLLRWDELKGPLSEAESFKLLHALTYHFCVTWRNGVIGRRQDQMAAEKESQKFGTGGVAFRARLG